MKSMLTTTIFAVLLGGTVMHERAVAQDQDDEFAMEVQDVFRLADGGVTITGLVASGTVSVDDTDCLISESAGQRELKVTGIEMFRKVLDSASVGDRIGLLIAGVSKEDLKKGDRLVASCSQFDGRSVR